MSIINAMPSAICYKFANKLHLTWTHYNLYLYCVQTRSGKAVRIGQLQEISDFFVASLRRREHFIARGVSKMPRKYIYMLAINVPMLSIVTYSPANATSISVAVAANFAGTLGDIKSAFETDYPGDTFTITSDSSGNITNAITSGNSPGYDLFLSADTSYPATVASAGWATGTPFTYAKGEILLWSSTNAGSSLNVICGRPLMASGNFCFERRGWLSVICPAFWRGATVRWP